MNFIDFKNAVAKQFDLLSKQPELFRTTASKDELWDTHPAIDNTAEIEQRVAEACATFIERTMNTLGCHSIVEAIRSGK